MKNFSIKSSGTHFARHFSLALAGIMLAGCPAERQASEGPASPSNPNQIVIRGSNTIGEELAPHLITEFKKDHAGVSFDIETKATGYGLAALRAGKCDIAAASRLANKEELEAGQNMHMELEDHPIGYYGVAVVVHARNAIANLTTAQVRDIFTGVIQNWKDVGGPDVPIHVYVRDPISGTYLGFRELAMDNKAYASNPNLLGSYEAIVQAVAQDEAGIGYTGVGLPAGVTAKAISINGIEPTAASVNGGKYPYARALYLYTCKNHESALAKDFVQYVLSAPGQKILAELGFVPHS